MGMDNILQESVRLRHTHTVNSSVYAITCVSLTMLPSMSVGVWPTIESYNAEPTGKIQNFNQ